ncbi:MAG TPA: YncE family protein, partial [Caldimonas sp.]|nr:YncE family protein [Caldimonas sp.]
MKHRLAAIALLAIATLAGCAAPPSAPGKRALMIVGNDEKQSWNDAGAGVMAAGGRDTVSVVDIGSDPLAPRIVANLPLANTIFGPPTNLAITPDEGLALVANSVNIVDEAGVLKSVPDTRLWVIDLTANPPRLIDTVTVGKQPSGMTIN